MCRISFLGVPTSPGALWCYPSPCSGHFSMFAPYSLASLGICGISSGSLLLPGCVLCGRQCWRSGGCHVGVRGAAHFARLVGQAVLGCLPPGPTGRSGQARNGKAARRSCSQQPQLWTLVVIAALTNSDCRLVPRGVCPHSPVSFLYKQLYWLVLPSFHLCRVLKGY